MQQHEYTYHEKTIRPVLSATATRPPGRGREWTVEVGQHWRATGKTEKAAADLLAGLIGNFLIQYETPRIITFRGHTVVLSLSVGDGDNPVTWEQQTITPDGRVSYRSCASGASWDEAVASAQYDLAHRTTDWHDDDSVEEALDFVEDSKKVRPGYYGPAELREYARWQRAAKAAMDAGRADWHEWASVHWRDVEFAVPRPPHNQPPPGAGVCDRCGEWKGNPATFTRCPTCGNPWSRTIPPEVDQS